MLRQFDLRCLAVRSSTWELTSNFMCKSDFKPFLKSGNLIAIDTQMINRLIEQSDDSGIRKSRNMT